MVLPSSAAFTASDLEKPTPTIMDDDSATGVLNPEAPSMKPEKQYPSSSARRRLSFVRETIVYLTVSK